jgi:putative ABC transport system ATP-binding protein
MAILEARNVCKEYRQGTAGVVRALDDVSLTIARGSLTALRGPSGSGKTTLLALLGALDRPSRGQVLLEGQDLSGYSDVALARVRRRFGFIFQSFSLIAGLPVWENITYPLIPRGMARARRRALAETLLGRLGLASRLSARPEELSGGEQQRVAIARALAGQPEVLFADEPTSNLDPQASRVLAGLLREIHGDGTTLVIASHDPELIDLATEVYELQAGTLKPPAC